MQRLLAPLFKIFPVAVVSVVLLSTVKFARSTCLSIVLIICFRCQKSTLLLRSGPKRGFESFLCSASHRFPSVARSTNCSTELRNIIIRKIKIMQKMKNNSERRWNDAEISLLRQLIGNLAWLARSSRPSLALCAARLQQHIFRTTVKDVTTASRLVDQEKEARASYSFPGTPWTCGRFGESS